jgi:hypothetical protein
MKSIKQQYIDLQEGNMSQANFMRNLRMTLPQYVTNVTSYEDSVKILKNKGILTEADISISKDTLDKVRKVISDLTAKNDDYHRDGYTMGFFEGKELSETLDPTAAEEIALVAGSYEAAVDKLMDMGLSSQEADKIANELYPEMAESLNELAFPLMDQWLKDIKDKIEDRWQNGKIATPAEYGSVMTKLSKPSDIIAKYGKMDAEDAANELLNSVSHLGSEYDPGPGEDEDFERDYDADYEEPNEPFDMAESLNEAKDNSSEGKWKKVTGKDLYSHFKELDNLNGHEVAQGIDWEMQCNPELPKKDIIKKVIKNLKKNPIYYTSWDLSGKEGYEPETMGPKADIAARQMQPLEKNMSNVVDKKMGMQPVKGIEKPKKDSDKGGETNKPEKGISLMSLIAKSVRGLKKMDATGEKMKKISIKEGEYTTNWEFNDSEKKTIRDLLNDNEIDFDVETEPGQTTKTTVSSTKNADKNVKHAVQQARGEIKNTHSSAGEGVAKFLTKERLKEIIRQEIAGAYGGDAMDAEDGSSYTKEQ